MSTRKHYLQCRREQLVMQAAVQRNDLSTIATHLQTQLQWVDRVYAVGQALRAHPSLVVATGALLVFATRSNRLHRIGQLVRAWGIFSMVRYQYARFWPFRTR